MPFQILPQVFFPNLLRCQQKRSLNYISLDSSIAHIGGGPVVLTVGAGHMWHVTGDILQMMLYLIFDISANVCKCWEIQSHPHVGFIIVWILTYKTVWSYQCQKSQNKSQIMYLLRSGEQTRVCLWLSCSEAYWIAWETSFWRVANGTVEMQSHKLTRGSLYTRVLV